MVRRPNETSNGKDEPDLPPNIFVIGLLHDLKRGGYSWQAWGAFWRASWIRAMQIFGLNDELRASWLRFTVAGVVGIVLAGAPAATPRPAGAVSTAPSWTASSSAWPPSRWR